MERALVSVNKDVAKQFIQILAQADDKMQKIMLANPKSTLVRIQPSTRSRRVVQFLHSLVSHVSRVRVVYRGEMKVLLEKARKQVSVEERASQERPGNQASSTATKDE